MSLFKSKRSLNLPPAIIVDNGDNFTKQAFLDTCMQAGINIVHLPPFHPRHNAIVERLFSTLSLDPHTPTLIEGE